LSIQRNVKILDDGIYIYHLLQLAWSVQKGCGSKKKLLLGFVWMLQICCTLINALRRALPIYLEVTCDPKKGGFN